LGQRSRKRGRHEKPSRAAMATAPRPLSRSEQRDAAVRSTLIPLDPGERPWALRIAVLLALLSGLVQVALFVFGVKLKVAGTHAQAGPTIVFGALMLGCAIGMWKLKYQALLGFMVLLGITIVYFALALIKASNLLGLAIGLAGTAGGGWLFYKLVRVLSRLQMPEYPGSRR
jgi:hypothetical protein